MNEKLRKASKLASCAIVAMAASTSGAHAILLSNGSLAVDIRADNGAISAVNFGGSDFYNPGSSISNWGLQNGTDTSTFRINTTSGTEQISVGTADNSPTSVDVTGTYTAGGANVALTRSYSLVPDYNVLRITSTFTNNAGSSETLRYFDTFDPDQGIDQGFGFATFNDVFDLSYSGGTIQVGQAQITPGLTVTMGGEGFTVASGFPFQIMNGNELNAFFASPFDGEGAFADMGTHVGFELTIAAGQSVTVTYDQAYGTTPTAAQNDFAAAQEGATTTNDDTGGGTTTTSVPEPAGIAMFGLGLVGLGFSRRKRAA